MQRLIIPDLWIPLSGLLWSWYRIHCRRSLYFFAWMIRWYLNLAQNLKMFQNYLTMLHTTVPTIWMDTALWVSCSAYLSGIGIKYLIFPFLLVMYDLAPVQTGRRGRPAKYGKRLSVETDFTFSNEKIGDYYTSVRRVLAKIFGNREILAYVTATEKEHDTKWLFFSTIFPEDLQIFCAWQEKAPLNQIGSDRMKYIPLLLYSFRWNIETSYYEQKTFWSFCDYMVRSCKGIEMLVNLINISYCAMKILPYQNEHFSE